MELLQAAHISASIKASVGDPMPPCFRKKKIVRSSVSSKDSEKVDQQQLPANVSLHDAIKLGNVEWVKQLLGKGASTKSIDSQKNSPLHLAFTLNHGDIVDSLLSHIEKNSEYANWPNDRGITQLHIAASRGNALVVEKLLDAGANATDLVHENSPTYPGYTALQFACDAESLETTRVLAKAMRVFGNITEDNEEAFASMSQMLSNPASGRYMMNIFRNDEPLSGFHEACLSSRVENVLEFLNNHVNVNASMDVNSKNYPLYTSLHFAVESSKDRQSKVELLLKHGADADRKNGLGMTPLHLACYNDTNKDRIDDWHEKKVDDTLRILYDAVKDKEANPMDAFGLTYLHVAVAQNDLLLVKRMLFRGEDIQARVLPNVRDFSNYTTLHFAARFGRGEMAKLLIDRGAEVRDEDDHPRYDTPLQTAIIHGNSHVIGVLLEHGANTRVVQPTSKKTTLHLLADRFEKISSRTTEGTEEKERLSRLVEKLVEGGANVDAKNSHRLTALHSCCANLFECSGMVRRLLHAGADINVKVGDKTALDYAEKSRFRHNLDDFFALYDHVQKLKDLGLKVDPKNEKFCEELLRNRKRWEKAGSMMVDFCGDEALARKKRERQEEICKLKRDMLTDKVSMYDYIRMNEKKAAAFLANERFAKINGIVEAQGLYENYGYLIPVVFRKSRKWIIDNVNSKKTIVPKPSVFVTRGGKRKRS